MKAKNAGKGREDWERLQTRCPPRQQRHDKMTGIERRWYSELQLQLQHGLIVWCEYKPFNLRLADLKCWYEVDFAWLDRKYQIHIDETKGRWYDDALVKINVAARLFPMFRFRAMRWVKKQWVIREF